MVPKRVSRQAVKQDDKPSRDYELILIISPEVKEEDFDTTLDKVSRFITEKGGTISEVERWGKRKLAYPIKRFLEGNYVLTRFNWKSGLSKELESNLQISEEVLRHLLIKSE